MSSFQSLIVGFAIILLGIICRKKNVFSTDHLTGFELYLFKIAFPAYLFTVATEYHINDLINDYTYAYLSAFACIAIITAVLFFRIDSSITLCIKMLLTSYVNAAIYTIPIITFIFKDPKTAIIGYLVQVIVLQSVFIFILGMLKHQESTILKKIMRAISVPLVIMPILGYVLKEIHPIPCIVITVTRTLGSSASTMSLLAFGLMLGNIALNKNLLDIRVIKIVVLKNFIHPLIAFIFGYYIFSLNNYFLYSLIIATSAPTAFVVYIIAKEFILETEFIKKVIALSSIVSIINIFLIVLVMQNMQ